MFFAKDLQAMAKNVLSIRKIFQYVKLARNDLDSLCLPIKHKSKNSLTH